MVGDFWELLAVEVRGVEMLKGEPARGGEMAAVCGELSVIPSN